MSIIFLCAVLFLNLSTMLSLKKISAGQNNPSGYAGAIVGSGSMESALSVNDFILIKGADAYQTEDIATYVAENGHLITHRVAAVTENGYIMQGDANNVSDGEIAGQRFMGRVVLVIPGIGGIIRGLLSPAGLAFSLFFPIGLIVLLRLIKQARETNCARGDDENAR